MKSYSQRQHCVLGIHLAIVWDFLLHSLLIYGTYCELDFNVGENSLPQTKTCHPDQGTNGIWKTGEGQGKYSECGARGRGPGGGVLLGASEVLPLQPGLSAPLSSPPALTHFLRSPWSILLILRFPSQRDQPWFFASLFDPHILRSSCTPGSRHPISSLFLELKARLMETRLLKARKA